MEFKRMNINLKQQKLLSNPLRVKIVYLLAEEPMTSKQVAEALEMSPGNIHYHIQQLYQNDILELTEVREKKGINEKYYRAKATHFVLENKTEKGTEEVEEHESYHSVHDFTEKELEEFKNEYSHLLLKYLKKSVTKTTEKRKSYHLNLDIKQTKGEEME
ncbi:ArsR/SmtB family transcription factor [Alkalihalobacillus sp. 1P02AB]|uniref:ArsR/SmtB family transcription factor n=1 Tax=Alkalihalobacillus sp. 1P02AB TaxID=3132260 RepID=UPI0039A65A2A